MKPFLLLFGLAMSISAFSQETSSQLSNCLIIKTNVLSLVAQRPTVSVEKVFSTNFSAEVSFVQGQFNQFLFTDHYEYSGYLVRAKKYLTQAEFGTVSPYVSLNMGTLKRTLQTKGDQIGSGGMVGYPSRDFSANSIRGGGSLGAAYISKSKIIIDALVGLGYGKYTRIYAPNVNGNPKGYLDAQVWLSVGYCF